MGDEMEARRDELIPRVNFTFDRALEVFTDEQDGGTFIDHLGIQMYQSPVAAIAELVSNGWDADASIVRIRLPSHLGPAAFIQLQDDGLGMTFEDCQDRYLNVGYCRRGEETEENSPSGRPVLGRKGIGPVVLAAARPEALFVVTRFTALTACNAPWAA